jgi:hypothetical protein
MLLSAAAGPGRRICVDHADLPAAVWDRVAAHFGIDTDAAAIDRMTEQSQFYSKDVESQLFSGDQPEHRPVTDEMTDAARQFAEPGYRMLASRP